MMFQLNPQDAQFLYAETAQNLTNVTVVAIFDPSTVPGKKTIRYMDIVRHVQSRLSVNPFMMRKLVRVPLELDYPYWVDDEYFDIDCHIRHSRLPEPGDWRELCIYTARYHSRPLDMNRPLWNMEVVEGLDHVDGLPKGCFAILTKIHHSALDGAAIIRFSASMSDLDNKGTPAMSLEETRFQPSDSPSLATMLSRATVNNAGLQLSLFSSALRAAPGLVRDASSAVLSKKEPKYPVPQTRFDRAVSPHKIFDGTFFDLEKIKAIGKGVEGATINDIVLAICSGGVRKYLQHHDDLPGDSLIAWVPVNARDKGVADASGNDISAMTVPIFTEVANPIERLQAIHRATSGRKNSRSGGSARLLTELSQHIPALPQKYASQLLIKARLVSSHCNLFISNVQGPSKPLYMCGAQVASTFGMAPLADGLGLFIATPSYNGRIGFHVTSTREILPDIRFFVECLEASIAELQDATKPKKRARKKAARKTTKEAGKKR